MRQLASLLIVWRLLCCCFQENLVESYTLKCGLDQMTVQWPNGTFKECLHCEHCHPGRGLYPHKCGGTVTFPVIIECKKCDSGKTFSDTYDSSSCRRCQLCAEHEVVKKDCTLSSDTKCNETCNSDYFFSKLQQVCKRCSYCCLDGKDEEQPQCINKGLKAANRYCSPRPDRTCTPSTPTGTAISTESRSSTKHTSTGSVTPQGSAVTPKGSGTPTSSVTPPGTVVYTVPLSSSPKHLNEPASQQQNWKISLIFSSVGLGFIFVCIVLGAIYCLRKKIRRRRNRDCDLRNTSNVNEECAWFEKKGNKLGLPQLQNQGFVPTPQGSHAGTPCQTDDELDELPDVESVDPKHSRGKPGRTTGRPGRTEEIKADVSLRENQAELDNEEVKNAQTSGTVGGKGAQGGRERKHSRSGQILRRLPSISNDYQPLPLEDPDQPAEVSAGGPQRKRSRGNSILNALRKSSVHAVTGENTDQPSGQSSKDVTTQLVTKGPKIPKAGSRVEFICTGRESQQVFYKWYKDGQEFQGQDNSSLILDPLKVQDFGFYKCEVRSDKRYDSSCVESNGIDLDVTPAEGKSYRKLSEVFDRDLDLKETVANLLDRETTVYRKAYKHVAFHYKMTDIDSLERCKNPGEGVLDYLKSTQPDLTVYHFCKVLKGETIRRLDIVSKLVDYL